MGAGAEIWVARKIAMLSRHLPQGCVGVVDSAIARIIAREAGGRVIDVAGGKIIETAPGLHEQRVEEERRRRYVASSRTDEAGLRTVIARVQAGQAVWIKATVTRVAEIISPQHPDESADEVRAIAFGYLARPAELLELLLEHTEDEQDPAAQPPAPDSGPEDPSPVLNRALALPYADPGQGGPPGQTGTHNSGPLGRRHHRWKTHAGYQARQSGQGRCVWTTPHGLGFLVDHSGTRCISTDHAQMILDAPAGVDIYPSDLRIELDLPRNDVGACPASVADNLNTQPMHYRRSC